MENKKNRAVYEKELLRGAKTFDKRRFQIHRDIHVFLLLKSIFVKIIHNQNKTNVSNKYICFHPFL